MKKLLIGVGIVFGVTVIALVALVSLINVNQFKPRIEQYVKDNYQRTLTIEGDLGLSLFPRIALSLPKTTLSNRAGDRIATSLDGAKVSVALFPLLRKEIVVDKITVTGLQATIERRKDGSTNIDDLIKAEPKEAEKPAAAPSEPPRFEVGGVQLQNADLTLDDKVTNSVYKLSNLNLETGRLATQSQTPITLDTSFSSTHPSAAGNLQLKGRLNLDLIANTFGASNLELKLKGTVDKKTFDVATTAGEVRVDGASGAVGADKVDLQAKGQFADTQISESRIKAPALAFDPLNKVLSVGGFEGNAKGKLGADAFEVQLSAPKLQADKNSASGERVSMTFKLAGAGATPLSMDAKFAMEGMSGNAQALAITRVALNADVQQGERKIAAALAGPATVSFDTESLAMPKLSGEIVVDDPAIPQRQIKMPLTTHLELDHKKQRIDVGLTGKFDETALSVEFDVREYASSTPPRIALEASADKLNVDRYFPAPKPAPGNDSADPKEDPKIDFSGLKSLNLLAQVRVGQLQARGIKASNVRATLKAAGGRVEVSPLNLNLYGGSVAGTAMLDADGNKVAVKTEATGVNVGPLLRDAMKQDLLDGNGTVKLDINTRGATVGAMRKGVNGTTSMALKDGAIKGINLAQKVRDAKTLLASGKTDSQRSSTVEKTDFSEMTASFAIKNGVAVNKDLDVKSPLLRIKGGGQVDVGEGAIDYVTTVSVVGTLKGQDGRTVDQLRGVSIPVKLSGPFEKMSWNIDWSSAAQDALKGKLTEQLTDRLSAPTEQQKDKIKDRVRDLLKR